MIPLHVHSNYTFLSGTIPPKRLVELAKEKQFPALAITDTDGMHGIVQFAKAAAETGIKPIFGTLISLDDSKKYIILLARNNAGYSAICKMITRKKLDEDFSFSSILKDFSANLFYITPSIDDFDSLGGFERDNVFLEKNPHFESGRICFPNSEEERLNPRCVFTQPVYFEKREDFILHKIVMAMKNKKMLATLKRDELADESFYFPDLRTAFPPDDPRSVWIENTYSIMRGSNVDLKLPDFKFPAYPFLENKISSEYLWELCLAGLHQRYKKVTEKIFDRLQYELDVIAELNFTDYFLVVWDIVNEANRRGIMHIGRGSAANSLVAYCLGFTEIDPIKEKLYFERFLNRSRTSPPDVDLDFSWKERDEIIKFVFERYGYDRVAMISTTVTFRARSAFREVAKVYGYSNSEISQYSKFIPWTSAANLENVAELFPESKDLPFHKEPWKTIVRYASRLSGYPHHLSIHPSGILIAPNNITQYVALDYAKNKGLGLIVTQPDMYSIEDIGLVKIDLLSQRSLGVLRDTLMRLDRNEPS